MYDHLGHVSNLAPQLLDNTHEQVPGPKSDTRMAVMDQCYEAMEDLRDILLVSLEEAAVFVAKLHILQDNGGVRKACNAYIDLVRACEGGLGYVMLCGLT